MIYNKYINTIFSIPPIDTSLYIVDKPTTNVRIIQSTLNISSVCSENVLITPFPDINRIEESDITTIYRTVSEIPNDSGTEMI